MHAYFDAYGGHQVHNNDRDGSVYGVEICGANCRLVAETDDWLAQIVSKARTDCARESGIQKHHGMVIRDDLSSLCTWCGETGFPVYSYKMLEGRIVSGVATNEDLRNMQKTQWAFGLTEPAQLAWYQHATATGGDWHLLPADFEERSLNPHMMYRQTLALIDRHLASCAQCREKVAQLAGFPIETVLKLGTNAVENRKLLGF